MGAHPKGCYWSSLRDTSNTNSAGTVALVLSLPSENRHCFNSLTKQQNFLNCRDGQTDSNPNQLDSIYLPSLYLTVIYSSRPYCIVTSEKPFLKCSLLYANHWQTIPVGQIHPTTCFS